MHELVEVKLRNYGKVGGFDKNKINLKLHDIVVVEVERGLDYGKIICKKPHNTSHRSVGIMKRILRLVTETDLSQIKNNQKDVKNVFEIAKEKINTWKLKMKLVNAEYSFDRSKVIFYFTADERVDFRELVRDLAHIFKARIELKQIGVRDEVKMFGGFGCCGRELCCTSFLKDFEPVTIRMAKTQNMPLNPEKISGLCGRLMCCLNYEYHLYKECYKLLPKEGSYIQTQYGRARVISINTLKQMVVVEFDDESTKEIYFKGKKENVRKRTGKK
ncbi:MAG: stage 0 sporulation protein [Candidatus Omnitrophota bacterium]|nr:MAG: stage 0 sporulation protein [Candidatus Omnitrophota bacterium]